MYKKVFNKCYVIKYSSWPSFASKNILLHINVYNVVEATHTHTHS